jgi:hypothetical protein
MERFLSYVCEAVPGNGASQGFWHAGPLSDTGPAIAMNRHQTQPRRQSNIGEHFQGGTFVV